ncbi:unnamed protein product [Macrosiphum euphorbiae]|uniref:Uncharacterized protein n=1 Tax=Macrosiphum euphorbiae TaxID=13131 RepID=A0AAV0VWQ1_9HEMI|nr:unnamed protein product [Macrosiphum euphorbiae]
MLTVHSKIISEDELIINAYFPTGPQFILRYIGVHVHLNKKVHDTAAAAMTDVHCLYNTIVRLKKSIFFVVVKTVHDILTMHCVPLCSLQRKKNHDSRITTDPSGFDSAD